MSSGLFRLSIRGDQDVWFTGAPQQTYFLSIYKAKTPYLLESFEIPFDTSNVAFGSTVVCTIPVYGDFIDRLTLKFSLPALTYVRPGWTYPVNSTQFQPFIYLYDSTGNPIEVKQMTPLNPYYSTTTLNWFPYTPNLTIKYDGTRLTYTVSSLVYSIGFINTQAAFFGFNPQVGTRIGGNIVTFPVTPAGLTSAPFTMQQGGWIQGYYPPQSLTYLDSVATYIIRNASLIIGGQTIDTMTGEYIEIRQDLEVPYENQQALTLLNGKNDSSQSQIARTYLVTLPFTPEMRIPIMDLYRHDVKVQVSFETFQNITATSNPFNGFGFLSKNSYAYLNTQTGATNLTVGSGTPYVFPLLYANTVCYDGVYSYIFSGNDYSIFTGNFTDRTVYTAAQPFGSVSSQIRAEASFVLNGYVYILGNGGSITYFTSTQSLVYAPSTTFISVTLSPTASVLPYGLTSRVAGTDGTSIYFYSGVNNALTTASFTGVITTGSILTASAVTGTIAIGSIVTGTGVPAGTVILAQISGTSGGAGTYTVNTATAVGSTAMTSGGYSNVYQFNTLTRGLSSFNLITGAYSYGSVGTVTGAGTTSAVASIPTTINLQVTPVFDGRYMYFADKYQNSIIIQYDTAKPFTSGTSWTVFNYATSLSIAQQNLQASIFDGHYVYFITDSTSIWIRYDTTASFSSAPSWTTYNLNSSVYTTSASVGYRSPIFDGRYIFVSGTTQSIFLLYDTQGSFTSASSYQWFNFNTGVNSLGTSTSFTIPGGPNIFNVNLFDGRYIYSYPNGTPYIVRFDTSTPIAPNSLQATIIGDYITLPNTQRSPETPKEFLITQTTLVESLVPRFDLQLSGPTKELFIVNQTPTVSSPYTYGVPTSNLVMKFNDEPVFDYMNRYTTPLLFHTAFPQRNVLAVSFSRTPESNMKLAGSVNMSRIRNVNIQVGTTNTTRVYARSYNLFHVESGLGGLRFNSPDFSVMYRPDSRWLYQASTTVVSGTALTASGTSVLLYALNGGTVNVTGTTTDSSGFQFSSGTFTGTIRSGTQTLAVTGTQDGFIFFPTGGVFTTTGSLAKITGGASQTVVVNGVTSPVASQSTGYGYYVYGTFTGPNISFYNTSGTLGATKTTGGSGTNAFIVNYVGGTYTWAVILACNQTVSVQSLAVNYIAVYAAVSSTGNYNVYQANGTNVGGISQVGTTDGSYLAFTLTGAYSVNMRTCLTGQSIVPYSIAVGPDQSIVFIGTTTATTVPVYNQIGILDFTITTTAGSLFIIKANYTLYPVWGTYIQTSSGTVGGSMSVAISSFDSSIFIMGQSNGASQTISAYNAPTGTSTISTGPTSAAPGAGFVFKYNSLGVAQWGTFFNTQTTLLPTPATSSGITCDPSGNVYVCGYTQGSNPVLYYSTGNTLAKTVSPSTTGTNNVTYLAKYTGAGVFAWANWADTGFSQANSMSFDPTTTTVCVSGMFRSTSRFYNADGITYTSLTAVGTQDGYVARYAL